MMSGKQAGKLTQTYRQASAAGPSSSPSSAAKARASSAKRKREDEKPAAEIIARSQGEGAVTNSDISADEQLLRTFDLATKFGPCAGMTRLERWARAQKFGLEPPADVRETVMRLGGPGSDADQCLWHDRV